MHQVNVKKQNYKTKKYKSNAIQHQIQKKIQKRLVNSIETKSPIAVLQG